jgi:hypothetical protein
MKIISRLVGLIPFPDNNRHQFQTVGPCCCAAIIPGGAAAPPYLLHRLSLGIGMIRSNPPDRLHDETIEYRVRD